MKKRLIAIAALICIIGLLAQASSAVAQSYYFSVYKQTVHAYWQADGSLALDYQLVFQNNITGHAIEYVDIGMPVNSYDIGSVTADVDGRPLHDISTASYEGSGSGFAVGLGQYAIPPGKAGTVHVHIASIQRVLHIDSKDNTYASAVLIPFWFGASYVSGSTQSTVIFHLPPGLNPEEPRWHAAPAGYSSQPATGFDSEGRITYTWTNPSASLSAKYSFGASFPKAYVPESAIVAFDPFAWIGYINFENLVPFLVFGFIIFLGLISTFSERSRRKKYLPPSIRIEGNGIKRGLTAIEAAILLEQPLDKVMTMLLFAVIKKGAVKVVSRDPLRVEKLTPLPEGLRAYELDYIDAIVQNNQQAREKALRTTMLSLIRATTTAMKGFSRKETLDYYRNITDKAWQQVEAAGTPEVKSQKFDEVMEWTMLDKDYDDRTRRVFRDTPVFIPTWWARYDPVYHPVATSRPANIPSTPTSLPHLPGSDFAASVVNQVQGFSSSVVNNISSFTSSITNTTNPPPPSSSSSGRSSGGGGGRSCACACACAGCACACAGGGR